MSSDGHGQPSQHEAAVQRRPSPGLTQTTQSSVSFAPLQSQFGIVTPSGPHFERHHQGWWDIDPTKHRLMLNGSDAQIVRTPMVFTMDELMRLPAVSRFHFIECGANTGMEWGNVAVPTCQYTHGMLSCSEFTGVPLKLLRDRAGVDRRRGRHVLAEGADGSSMTRTVPMELIESGEVPVACGQNGEMLRPENGYPLRLAVPGVQGVSWVQYLRRIEVGDRPGGSKDETLHCIDLIPGGLHRRYTSTQECKIVVTTPSGGQVLLGRGYYNIGGLVWYGSGKVRRVEVSVDGGRHGRTARLETPVLSKCLTRFDPAFRRRRDRDDAVRQGRAVQHRGLHRLQNLPDLTGNPGDGIGFAAWPAYRSLPPGHDRDRLWAWSRCQRPVAAGRRSHPVLKAPRPRPRPWTSSPPAARGPTPAALLQEPLLSLRLTVVIK